MKLSVCIITYNHEAFIEQALTGALEQETEFDFEILVVDDCSKDRTRDVIVALQERYPGRITAIFNEKNRGLMANNAFAINQCKGEYIALLEGDDYWTYKHKLQRQVEFLDKNPQFALAFHDSRILNVDGQWHDVTCCSDVKKDVIYFTDIICKVHIPTLSVVFRRKLLGQFPPAWHKDLNSPDRPLFLLLTINAPAYYMRECWGVYRKHANGSWTSRDRETQWLDHLDIYHMVDRHFDFVHKLTFCKCEVEVLFNLAADMMALGRAEKGKRYFRKAIATSIRAREPRALRYIASYYWKSLKQIASALL